jgi:hypothetical protein
MLDGFLTRFTPIDQIGLLCIRRGHATQKHQAADYSHIFFAANVEYRLRIAAWSAKRNNIY